MKTIQAVIGFFYLCPGHNRFETSAGTTPKSFSWDMSRFSAAP